MCLFSNTFRNQYWRRVVIKTPGMGPPGDDSGCKPKKIEKSDDVLAQKECVVGAPMEPGATVVPSGNVTLGVSLCSASLERCFKNLGVDERCHSPSPDDANAIGCLKTLVQIFILYGFDFEQDRDLLTISKAFDFYRNSNLHWIKYFKTRIADFFSSWNGQELSTYKYSKGENPKYLFGGRFFHFTRKIMTSSRALSFSTSILQSKKGMPRASDDLVKKAEEDNMRTMISPKCEEPKFSFSWEVVYEPIRQTMTYQFGKSAAMYEIKRTVRELFRSWNMTVEDFSKPMFPSTSSNYNRTRSKRGTYGEINETAAWRRFVSDIEEDPLTFSLADVELHNYVSEYYGQDGIEDTIQKELLDLPNPTAPGLAVNTASFVRAYRRMYWSLVNDAIKESPLVEVVGLKEALKIRCISKGPPLTYFVLRSLQKSLHSHLRHNRIFELVGTPITEELMQQRFGHLLDGNHRFHSGDYSAATDGLFSWCSEAVASELNEIFKEKNGYEMGPLYDLFVRSLTGHIYVDKEGNQFPQMRGQLMGSITSFPVLCILNCALMRWSLELSEERGYTLKEFPGWINGDDCFTPYKAGNNFPCIWEGLAKLFGFEKSLGKTYDSPDFGSMNSTTFENRSGVWRSVNYVNLGLFNAVQRSSQKDESPPAPSELGVLHQQLMSSCPPEMRRTLTAAFIERHRDVLNTFAGSWFLPQWMGGLGLVNLESWSREDRRYAYHAQREAMKSSVSLSRDKAWMHYDLFNREVGRLGEGLVVSHSYESYEGEDSYGLAFVAMVYCLGWAKDGLSTLYNPHASEEDRITRSLLSFTRRVNRRIQAENQANEYHEVKDESVFEVEMKRRVTPVFAQ